MPFFFFFTLVYKSALRYNFQLFHIALAHLPAGGGVESEMLLFCLKVLLFFSLLPVFSAHCEAINT